MQLADSRRQLHRLGQRLVIEYSGSASPGRVLALVYRTHHLLSVCPTMDSETRLAVCEDLVRQMLRPDHAPTARILTQAVRRVA